MARASAEQNNASHRKKENNEKTILCHTVPSLTSHPAHPVRRKLWGGGVKKNYKMKTIKLKRAQLKYKEGARRNELTLHRESDDARCMVMRSKTPDQLNRQLLLRKVPT